MSSVSKLTRRQLFRLGLTGTGLFLGITARPQKRAAKSPAPPVVFAPSALLRIDSTGLVTLYVTKLELGQGVHTALAAIVADELGVDLSGLRVLQAPYGTKFGNQETRGSRSVRAMYEPLREIGATARGMLMRAAESRLKVPIGELAARNGAIMHQASGRRLTFGALASAAARLSVPREPAKTARPSEIQVGKSLRRKDTPAKVDGSARFPIDIRVPGMLYACVSRSPIFGAKLATVDDAKARKVPGVKDVIRIRGGVAVTAESTWAAIQGRDALSVTWEASPMAEESSIKLRARMDEASQTGREPSSDPPAGSKLVEAVYETPFQAHQPMEPISATARISGGVCEVWAASQDPAWAMSEIKRITGLPETAIRLNLIPAGGMFGRGINPDFIVEAVEVAKAAKAPVKVFRTREDDTQFDRFRPATLHRVTGVVDSAGRLDRLSHRIVTTPIIERGSTPDVDRFELAGAAHLPYRVGKHAATHALTDSHVPRGCWRSVPQASNAFAIECIMDELAAAAGVNPLQFRLNALGEDRTIDSQGGRLNTARLKKTLIKAAERSGWEKAMPPRSGRGIACFYSFGSYVSAVAEVSVDKDGNITVSRVILAIDCGKVINPDSVSAQMEGSVAFGLTSALKSRITIEAGKAAESNFHNAPVLHINEMPLVDVIIMSSDEPPGGVGEPAVPVIAPALCNALFAATGVRIRALPVRTRLLRQR